MALMAGQMAWDGVEALVHTLGTVLVAQPGHSGLSSIFHYAREIHQSAPSAVLTLGDLRLTSDNQPRALLA